MEIRGYETYIVAYSGGKDSTATLQWALEHLPREQLRVVFCDTGAEWPETYDYIKYTEHKLDVTIDRIKAGDILYPLKRDRTPRSPEARATSLFDMVRIRSQWINPGARVCTTFLKHWPLRLYARQYNNPLAIEGTRAEESKSRASKPQFDIGGDKTGIPVFRPVLHWSEQQVWNYLRLHHILPNPVYNYAVRCGCWCCIMGRRAEVLNFCRLHPEIAQEAAELEQEIGHTWKEKESIGNLLAQARAQLELFERTPRFKNPLESKHE